MSVALLLILSLQDDLRERVAALDATTPEARDAAEEALRARLTIDARGLAGFAEDPRSEVRARVRRLLSTAPLKPLLSALFEGSPAESMGAAGVLAGRPWPASPDETLVQSCEIHATPGGIAIELARRTPVVLLESAWACKEPLKGFRGKMDPTRVTEAFFPSGLAARLRDGVLALGSPDEIEAWQKWPPFHAVFRDLVHESPRRRELAGRSLGRVAEPPLLRALTEIAHPRAREALAWALLDRRRLNTLQMPELVKPLEILLSEPGPAAVAACGVFRELPLDPDPALLEHERRETRYLALEASLAWISPMRARLKDLEPEIRLAAYQKAVLRATTEDVPWADLLQAYRSLPEDLAKKAWPLILDRFPEAEGPLRELLSSPSTSDRRLAFRSLLRSHRPELVDVVFQAVVDERDSDILSALVRMCHPREVRERDSCVDFLDRRIREGETGAVDPLAQANNPKALGVLIRHLSHDKATVRGQVVMALAAWRARKGGEQATRALGERQSVEPNPKVKTLIDRVLGRAAGEETELQYVMELSCATCRGVPAGVWIERPSFASAWR